MKAWQAYRVCIECREPMNGIHCYSIRRVCTPCGGFATGHEPKKKQPKKSKPK